MANKTSSFLDNSPPKVDQIWLNMVTGEVANAIPMAGDSVDSTGLVNNQLTNAVKSYVSQAGILCTDTSSGANVYILNASTPFTNPVLKTGTRVRFKTANANTGSSTITAFGGSAIICKKSDGSTNLATGDITANSEVEFVYNGTNWVKTLYGVATTTNQGVIEIATNAETAAGTDTERAIVPSALAALFGTSDRSSNGYARLPVKVAGAFVEIIIQWGTASVSSAGTVVTLPIAYTTTNAVVLGNGDVAGQTMVAQSKTTTNFTGFKSGTGSANCSWISIGY